MAPIELQVAAVIRVGDAVKEFAPLDGQEPLMLLPLQSPGGELRYEIPLSEDGVARLLALLGGDALPARHLRVVGEAS
jgi:hypothetical protein